MKHNLNKIQKIISNFSVTHDISEECATEIFKDLILYLDRSEVNRELSPSKIVDEAWHFFILYTREYISFCEDRYGHFKHHTPLKVTRLENSPLKMMMKASLVMADCGEGDCNSDGTANDDSGMGDQCKS